MKFSQLTKPELEEILKNANFTEDEEEIFKLLARGKSLEEIAQWQSTSKSTISRRVVEIKNKMERSEHMNKNIPVWEKITLTVDEAAEYSNIGVNKISNMLNEPSCPFVLFVGKGKRLVKRKEFERYIEKASEI